MPTLPQPSTPSFTGTEAWILLGVAMCDNEKGANVRDVIAAGDYINHAIFNASELRRGFAKLVYAGFVEDKDDHFFLAGKAREFWARFKHSRKSVIGVLKSFETFLEVVPKTSGLQEKDDDQWQYPRLTDEVVDQAYQEYNREFQAILDKMKRGKKK